MCKLSAVIPCYNEQSNISELYTRLSVVCKEVVGDDYEIVLVNDGSSDDTWGSIKSIASIDSHVVGINLSRNYGHQVALTAGLRSCSAEYVFILDADLQDPPEVLRDMFDKIQEGYDVVYGKRRERLGEGAFKLFTAKAFYRILRVMVDIDIPLDTGDFRLMTRKAVDALNSMPENHRFIRGMVTWVGFKQGAVEYVRNPRASGLSAYPIRKMVRFAVDAITSFSIMPLKIATASGLLFGFASFIGILYSFVGWMLGETVQGWTSMMLSMFFLGGVQLVTLGVLGEYVGRMYIETKRRPLYVTDEIVNKRGLHENEG